MSEAWRAVVEYQVLVNGQWEDRRFTTKPYDKGSNGPMGAANAFVRNLEAGRHFEGTWYDKNLVKFSAKEVIVLSKYKEESETWKQI